MRTIVILFNFFLVVSFNQVNAQNMNPEKLEDIIRKNADTVITNGNSIQFLYQDIPVFCIYDVNANRMRIISPIVETTKIEEEQLLNMLVANFHSALDVKYALSDEIIWSVFIHPLKELSEHQVADAISQVYSASQTFGSTYSSTDLIFPGNTKKRDVKGDEKRIRRF